MANIEKYDSPYYKPSPAFYSGTSYSQLVPYPFPVSIGGHAYQLQWDAQAIGVWGAKFKRVSLPLIRGQADNSNTPGEQSISPEQFWRRSQENWVLGEGQSHLDRANSDLRRYNDGEGIDPWTPWQIKLLNKTAVKKTSSNSNLQCIVAGSYVYFASNSTIQYSTDLSSWTTVTESGSPASVTSMATDGNSIYLAQGTSGIYKTTVGASSATSYATYSSGSLSLVRFVKSRLMAASGGKLFNILASGALTDSDVLLNLTARSFTWVDIVGSPTQIYAGGYTGDKSFIYRTAIKADGTALDVPIVAAQLPDGEIIASLGEYLGYIFIGSNKGMRLCTAASDGSLVIGSLIQTYDTVYSFEGQDRFVWFSASNYDGDSGLYRLDLTNFTSTLVPAYASDLMSKAGSGTVRNVGTFNSLRIFTVDGFGLYSELADTPVDAGYFVSGSIGYGIADPKVAMFLDIKHEPLNGKITAGIIADKSDSDVDFMTATAIGISDEVGSVSPASAFPCGQLNNESVQIVFKLEPNASGVSPVLNRWTLRSYPAPKRTAEWNVPILLFPTITAGDKDYSFNVQTEIDYLIGLHQSQGIITFQVAEATYQVVMYDYQWLPEAIGVDGQPRGTLYAQLREIVG